MKATDDLRHLVQRSSSLDRDAQRVPWSPEGWLASWEREGLPHRDVLELADVESAHHGGVRRRFVLDLAAEAPERLLIGAMIWGFGTTPYGPFRTGRMLENPDGIRHVVGTLLTGGPAAGYPALWTRGRTTIPWLGTSFGTKLLYFAGYERGVNPRPLIYDANVQLGLEAVGIDCPPPARLETAAYLDILRLAGDLAEEPDVVEFALFDLGNDVRRARRRRRTAT